MKNIAGLVPFTTIDFPEHLACVVFFQGCPLRCPFCHNPNLQELHNHTALSWTDVTDFLSTRKKRLDGVVLSGGEPLMQKDIHLKAKEIKKMGFKVALHTSGVFPERLKETLPYLDWVGLDIKAPKEKYHILTGRENISEKVYESLDLLINANVKFEIRTTTDPRFLNIEDIFNIAKHLKEKNIKTYALQKYRTFDTDKNPPSTQEIESFFNNKELIEFLNTSFKNMIYR